MAPITTDISAIILAAGFSSRMDGFKPLLPLGESNVLTHAVDIFLKADIGDIRVVIGHRASEIRSLVKATGAEAIINPRYRTGMLSSIQAGIMNLPKTQKAFFILPVDIPLVR